MYKFALIGASGYIAPRHVEAIKKSHNDLVALLDPYDGIGYIDKHYPKAAYFKDLKSFEKHLDDLRVLGNAVNYISICSPNHLHYEHIKFSLKNDCNVICEKPLVLIHKKIKDLKLLEKETGKRVNTILQLRHHPTIIELKKKYSKTNKIHKISLDYITPRGLWYDSSWKGNIDKSGGLASNIGVHFFDMLLWIFGEVKEYQVSNTDKNSKGILILNNAEVSYNLSIKQEDLPWDEWKPYRSITIDKEEIEFSTGFTELHDISYNKILSGGGFTLEDVEPTIELIEKIRLG